MKEYYSEIKAEIDLKQSLHDQFIRKLLENLQAIKLMPDRVKSESRKDTLLMIIRYDLFNNDRREALVEAVKKKDLLHRELKRINAKLRILDAWAYSRKSIIYA